MKRLNLKEERQRGLEVEVASEAVERDPANKKASSRSGLGELSGDVGSEPAAVEQELGVVAAEGRVPAAVEPEQGVVEPVVAVPFRLKKANNFNFQKCLDSALLLRLHCNI